MVSQEVLGEALSRRELASQPEGNEPRSVEHVASLAMRSLLKDGRYRPATAEWRGSDLHRFAGFVAAEFGVVRVADLTRDHVVAFMEALSGHGAKPSRGTQRCRLFAVRAMVREGVRLGLMGHDPTLAIEPPAHASLRTRPLTDEEIELGRARSVASPDDRRRSVAWALSEATGRTSEIGLVRARDVDVGRGLVWLPGAPMVDARWGRLTPWAMRQVGRRLTEVATPDDPLIVWRTAPRTLRAACSQAVSESLRAAGLFAPDIRPRSIAAWAGWKAIDQGVPIDDVARLLGMRSLDQTAELVGFSWREGDQA